MFKSAHFAFALTLLLLAADAGARPGASFSHGFSSHGSSSHVSTPHLSPAAPARAPSGGFGSFSSRSAAAAPGAPAPARAPSGSFGAFGNAAATPKQSDSALSQQLGKNAAQANALRTLDERKAAKAAPLDRNPAPQPAPGYVQAAPAQPAPGQAQAPAPGPTTVIVQQGGGGLGHVLAGAMIARSANAHAGYYPAPNYNGGNGGAVQRSGGGSFFGVVLTLCCLALIAWGLWFAWRGWRKRRAALAEANKPNYSFERN
jgi:hypothetical protein